MGVYNLQYRPFNKQSILIDWPSKIDENVIEDILFLEDLLQKIYLKQKVYIKHTYTSILIYYDYTIDNIYDEILVLKQLYSNQLTSKKRVRTLWKIPVCYDEEFAVDLPHFSKLKSMSESEIIKRHTAQKYTLFFHGFLPGFMYLGGLDPKLYLERKETPDLQIKKGAVAIGGEQTGIYPQDSPGGWHVIGSSPINFFDVSKNQPCSAPPGDKIKVFNLEKEVL